MVRPVVCSVLLVLLLASCSAQQSPLSYVSLGDSLAVGVGASDPQERGYAPLFRDRLSEKTNREVKLTQLGVSGETSESFIGGYPDEGTSQLARAVKALQKQPGATVTLSLGGNDLLQSAGGTDADREAVIARYAANLDQILKTLKAASKPAPRITVLALYNPAPGSFTDEWIGRLNARIRAVAQRHDVAVADGDRAFRGRDEEYTRYARYPWDIHPTDKGYEALAKALAAASTS